MTAINSVVENTGEFIGTFRENVIRVIGNYSTQGVTTEYDEQIEKLQQQLLDLIEDKRAENSKNPSHTSTEKSRKIQRACRTARQGNHYGESTGTRI